MKRQIRFGVFETNSSSVHSLTIVSKEDYEKWRNGELIYDRDNDKLIPSQDVDEDEYDSYDYWNFNDYGGDFETSTTSYKTKSGDEIVIRSYFGYDG